MKKLEGGSKVIDGIPDGAVRGCDTPRGGDHGPEPLAAPEGKSLHLIDEENALGRALFRLKPLLFEEGLKPLVYSCFEWRDP